MNQLTMSKSNIPGDFTCELTKELDNHLKNDISWDIKKKYPSYVCGFNEKNTCLIRFFGATRGCIETNDEDIIVAINIYEDSGIYNGKNFGCFKESAIEAVKQFIGWKLVLT